MSDKEIQNPQEAAPALQNQQKQQQTDAEAKRRNAKNKKKKQQQKQKQTSTVWQDPAKSANVMPSSSSSAGKKKDGDQPKKDKEGKEGVASDVPPSEKEDLSDVPMDPEGIPFYVSQRSDRKYHAEELDIIAKKCHPSGVINLIKALLIINKVDYAIETIEQIQNQDLYKFLMSILNLGECQSRAECTELLDVMSISVLTIPIQSSLFNVCGKYSDAFKYYHDYAINRMKQLRAKIETTDGKKFNQQKKNRGVEKLSQEMEYLESIFEAIKLCDIEYLGRSAAKRNEENGGELVNVTKEQEQIFEKNQSFEGDPGVQYCAMMKLKLKNKLFYRNIDQETGELCNNNIGRLLKGFLTMLMSMPEIANDVYLSLAGSADLFGCLPTLCHYVSLITLVEITLLSARYPVGFPDASPSEESLMNSDPEAVERDRELRAKLGLFSLTGDVKDRYEAKLYAFRYYAGLYASKLATILMERVFKVLVCPTGVLIVPRVVCSDIPWAYYHTGSFAHACLITIKNSVPKIKKMEIFDNDHDFFAACEQLVAIFYREMRDPDAKISLKTQEAPLSDSFELTDAEITESHMHLENIFKFNKVFYQNPTLFANGYLFYGDREARIKKHKEVAAAAAAASATPAANVTVTAPQQSEESKEQAASQENNETSPATESETQENQAEDDLGDWTSL